MAELEPRPASASQTTLSVVMEIQHANNAGFVHGGTIMRLVDTAAGIAAGRHSRTRVVTAVMDDMVFHSPVFIGDLVTVRAMVNDAHRTSMEVGVQVEAETIESGAHRHVNSAHLVFVALDKNGKPAPVRRFWPRRPTRSVVRSRRASAGPSVWRGDGREARRPAEPQSKRSRSAGSSSVKRNG